MMFNLTLDNNMAVLEIFLPDGKTAKELCDMATRELLELAKSGKFYGKNVRIYGRLTTGMAMSMGHILAHVCKGVEIFDPKENVYYKVIGH